MRPQLGEPLPDARALPDIPAVDTRRFTFFNT
jgi:hypothetical protein